MRIFAMTAMKLAACCFASGLIASAHAQSAAPDDASWVVVRNVVAPLVPKEILMAGKGSQIDARIRVGPDGRLQEVLAMSSSPSSPELEDALRSALARWTYRTDANARCERTAYEGWVRVAIEIANGKPRTRVLQPARTRERVPGAETSEPAYRALLRDALSKTYPVAARRGRVEADLVAAVEFQPDTGAVTKVTPVVVDLLGGVESEDMGKQFAQALMEALSSARLVNLPAGAEAGRRCIQVSYRLSN